MALSGCATAPYYAPAKKIEPGIPGTYHKVQKGQTLWRIARIYGLDLDEIASINRLSDAASIESGALLFIPHKKKPLYTENKTSLEDDDFIWPIEGKVISTFGQVYNSTVNKGINIQPYANTGVVAGRGGRIVFCADDFKGFGKTIIIDHGDGFSSIYARNSQLFAKVGERVGRGSLIARAGSAGRDKNKYLHFEIRKGHIAQNPYFYLSR